MKEYSRHVSHRHGHDSGGPATLERGSTGFNFLSVEPTRVSVHLTWTPLGERSPLYGFFSGGLRRLLHETKNI